MPNLRTAVKVAAKAALVGVAARVALRATGMRCLMYHSVVASERYDASQMTVSTRRLADQLALLRDEGFRVEDAGKAVADLNAGNDRSVAITFDDGFSDNCSLALPVLERYGFPVTVFLVADALVGRIRPLPGSRYLDVRQAREMLETGLVRFGCHGATHRRLRGMSSSDLKRETADAKHRIEDALGTPVTLFAYPYGAPDSFDRQVRTAVSGAGFVAAFTSIVGTNKPAQDRFLLLRTRVSWAETLPSFSHLMRGSYDWYAGVQWLQARYALLHEVRGDAEVGRIGR
jgi:peptidoglycan/xylan/chitin deacetylase (PgdA/CDA1 family)